MRRLPCALLLLVLFAGLTGCGNKGPLTRAARPAASAPAVPSPTSTPANAASTPAPAGARH